MDRPGARCWRWTLARRALSLLLMTCWSLPAFAHAPPRIHRIEWQQGAGDGIALLTNRGLILRDAAGAWRLMCHTVLGINSSERPDYQLRADGRLLVATSGGLRISDDGGCTWGPHGQFANVATPAMTWDPSRPEKLWIAIRLDTGESSVFTSEDGGEVWSQLSTLEEGSSFEALDVAPSDPTRLYASGFAVDPGGTGFSYFIAASSDGGESWTQRAVAMEANEMALELLAVSPADPEVIALVARDESPEQRDRLLVSLDGGQTTRAAGEVLRLDAATFSADGARLWAVGLDGLFVSDDLGQTLEAVSTTLDMSCVHEHDGQLLVCGLFEGDVLGRDGVGVSTDGDAPFAPFMTFEEVEAPVDCDPCSTTAEECQTWWQDWEIEILKMPDPPAAPACNPGGSSDATVGPSQSDAALGAPDAGEQRTSGGHDGGGCSCRTAGRRAAEGAGTASLAGLALLWGVGFRHTRRRGRRLGAPNTL